MAQRPVMIALYATGLCAGIAIVAGVVAMIATPTHPSGPAVPVRADPAPPVGPPFAPAAPSPQDSPPLTATSPAVASNGRITIRLLGGQPER